MDESVCREEANYDVRPDICVILSPSSDPCSFSIYVIVIAGMCNPTLLEYLASFNSKLAFIPLWILPSGFSALAAGAFCLQLGVQGAWGVVRLLFVYHAQFLIVNDIRPDSNPPCRNVPTSVPCDIPGCCLPAWKCNFCCLLLQLEKLTLIADGFVCFCPDRSQSVLLFFLDFLRLICCSWG